MFEEGLKEKLKRIFDVAKVTFDQPGEAKEQKCLFVEMNEATVKTSDGIASGRASGRAIMFGRGSAIPFGMLSKAIGSADPLDKKDFYFFNVDTNTKTYRDLVQRGFEFVYFFRGQYDPDIGTITAVELNIEETP